MSSGSGRSPGEQNGNPLQCSSLENPWIEELVGFSQWAVREPNRTEQPKLTVPVNQTRSESGRWKAECPFFKKVLKATGVRDEYPSFCSSRRTNIEKYRNSKDTVFSSLKSVFRAMDFKHEIIKPEKLFLPPKLQNLICNMVTFNR